MHVRWLELVAFRNYASLRFTPDAGLNVLVGDNGHVKFLAQVSDQRHFFDGEDAPGGVMRRIEDDRACIGIECGAQFVVAAGVEAQEYHYLSMEERRDLIAMTIDFVDGRAPVAVGISHPSFRTAVDLGQFAQDCGASALQLLAPLRSFGGPPTDDDLIRYFEAVVAETDAPLVAYLNPGPGADVSVAGTIALLKVLVHPALVYLVGRYIVGLPPIWVGVGVLFAACPSGINAYLLAERYRKGVAISSGAILISTVISLASMLFWVWFVTPG